MEIKEIQEKFSDKIKPSGWYETDLFNLIRSPEFVRPIEELWNQATQNNMMFTPQFKDLLKAYELCNYNDLKVVIVGQDPYPQAGVADGIAFSCSKTNKEQPSLRYIFVSLSVTPAIS